MKAKPKELSLKSKLRILGFKLARAEMYGTKKDITAMKRAHEAMLRKYYGRGRSLSND